MIVFRLVCTSIRTRIGRKRLGTVVVLGIVSPLLASLVLAGTASAYLFREADGVSRQVFSRCVGSVERGAPILCWPAVKVPR